MRKIIITLVAICIIVSIIIFNNINKEEIKMESREVGENKEKLNEIQSVEVIEENQLEEVLNQEQVMQEESIETKYEELDLPSIQTDKKEVESEEIKEMPSIDITTNIEKKVEENEIVEEIELNVPIQEIIVETPKEKVEEIQIEKEKDTINIEEFRVNNEMIEKIKNAINQNPSQSMLDYGYTVIVDSTIVEYTNHFTYTDKRIVDKLVRRYDEIKIYAQDYYIDGKYLWTECYIL